MVKNKLVKNVTIDELAVIINNGFQGQMDYMEKKFEAIDKNFEAIDKNFTQVASKKELDEVKKDVKYIKENLDDASKLGQRVDYIEGILNIQPIKK